MIANKSQVLSKWESSGNVEKRISHPLVRLRYQYEIDQQEYYRIYLNSEYFSKEYFKSKYMTISRAIDQLNKLISELNIE